MYFAYFDESGDSGVERSPTNTFTLSAVLIHDCNWLSFLDQMLRAMRRFHHVSSAFCTGTLSRAAENIIEDPFDKRSTESYFVQWADLNAYAAFRRTFPGSNFGVDIWDELGAAIITDVNRLSGGPPGIVVWPS